jgi:hypothetical protein
MTLGRWWRRPPFLLRMVIVNLKDDPTLAIRGLVWDVRGEWIVLRDAELLKSGVEPARLAGESAIVSRENVSFFQVP